MILSLRTAWIIAQVAFAGLMVVLALSTRTHGERRDRHLAAVATGLFLVLVLVRAPELYGFDRVWAETSTLYFLPAYEHGPAGALFRQVSNYFDLAANLGSFLAVLAGLHLWPVVDIGLGFVPVIALPFALAGLGFTARERAGILLVVAMAIYSIHSGETFGTVLHVKGWGAIYAFLVLLGPALGRPLGLLHKALVVVLPLTGPPAALLFFVYGGAAVLLRPRRSYGFMLWALPGLAVQVISALGAGRGTGFEARPLTPLAAVYGADLFVGRIFGGLFFPATVFNPVEPGLVQVVLTNLAVVALLAAALALYLRRPDRRDLILLFPVIVGQFIATVTLAVGGAELVFQTGGPRYFFPTLCMVGALAMTSSYAARLPFVLAAITFAGAAILVDRPLVRAYDYFALVPHNPPWKIQIEADFEGPDRTIKTYPSNYTFVLPRCGEHYCGTSR